MELVMLLRKRALVHEPAAPKMARGVRERLRERRRAIFNICDQGPPSPSFNPARIDPFFFLFFLF